MPLPSLDDVTEEEVTSLAMSAGGLDLSHPVRRQFLTEMGSKDVQAAPGAGKTTLLGLKLRLIGRRWNPGMGALAVVTHTNVAKREIQGQLQNHPEAESLLRYPHFIGTLTQFAHQYLALPTCSGLGFEIQTVDTEIFKSAAIKALMGESGASGWLAGQSGLPENIEYLQRVRAGAKKIASVLTLDANNPRGLTAPANLGTGTPTYAALQVVKTSLNARGLFSYEDMMAIANHALLNISGLSQALANRFPMFVLDEAQDTSSEAFQMLHAVRDAGAVLQCIGDVNQAILADGASPAWNVDSSALDLNESKRFGASIAAVASKLGVHRPQQIVSAQSPDSLLYAILFPSGAEHLVPSEYAKIVAEEIGPTGKFWAVGHRKNPSETAKKQQLVIGSYFPGLNPSNPESQGNTLHQSIIQFGRGGCALDIVEGATRQIIQHCCDLNEEQQRVLRQGWLLKALDRHHPDVAAGLRKWISTNLGSPPFSEQNWQAAQAAVLSALAPLNPASSKIADCHHLKFCPNPLALDEAVGDKTCASIDVEGTNILINIGTIASIKGQTHDATLILQTAFGNMKPFGKFADALNATTAKSWGPKESTLLANFYVAATRPRKLLAIAAEKSQISGAHRNHMMQSGWTIIDLVAPPTTAT
jgi:DNA helicase II / ATP-dependent DNA helicase PcrA